MEAFYSDNVGVHMPQKVFFSKDAVPAIFSDCSSYLSKKSEKRKRPAERHGNIAHFKKQRKKSPDCSDAVFVMDSAGALSDR